MGETGGTLWDHHDGLGDRCDPVGAALSRSQPGRFGAGRPGCRADHTDGNTTLYTGIRQRGALEALATDQACLAMDYSGDVDQAAARAKEAGKGVNVTYVAPKEGAEVGFDMLATPSDAPHKEEALAFINFVLRPDIMARITDATPIRTQYRRPGCWCGRSC